MAQFLVLGFDFLGQGKLLGAQGADFGNVLEHHGNAGVGFVLSGDAGDAHRQRANPVAEVGLDHALADQRPLVNGIENGLGKVLGILDGEKHFGEGALDDIGGGEAGDLRCGGVERGDNAIGAKGDHRAGQGLEDGLVERSRRL